MRNKEGGKDQPWVTEVRGKFRDREQVKHILIGKKVDIFPSHNKSVCFWP